MKIKCSCGAKYEFDLRPEMADNPVSFVCPACGLDASEFVDGLIRQGLGQSSTPTGVPIPVFQATTGSAAGVTLSPVPESSARSGVRLKQPQSATGEAAAGVNEDAPRCLKHPGELA